jgi:hypothetical protein
MQGELGRIVVFVGVVLVVVGLVLIFSNRIPWLGRLPGDIVVRRENFTIYVPIVTMILVSVVLTVLLNLFWRR